MDPMFERPPSRHRGSRTVARTPDVVQVISAIREDAHAQATRTRRDEIPMPPVTGVTVTATVWTATHESMVVRSGHTLYADLAVNAGAASVVEVRLAVPALGVTGPVAVTGPGGDDVDVRATLALPDDWEIGARYRVRVQARRESGADSTTVRVLRCWQC